MRWSMRAPVRRGATRRVLAVVGVAVAMVAGLVPADAAPAVPTMQVAAPPSAFTEVAAGRDHSCAIDDTGQVWCWGSNERGQLGTGNWLDARTVPVPVQGLTDASAIAAGATHT
jgi:hypothetical protein